MPPFAYVTLAITVAACLALLWLIYKPRPLARPSVVCAPEVIRPTWTVSCGVPGCGIKTPHSHVEAFVRHMKKEAPRWRHP